MMWWAEGASGKAMLVVSLVQGGGVIPFTIVGKRGKTCYLGDDVVVAFGVNSFLCNCGVSTVTAMVMAFCVIE